MQMVEFKKSAEKFITKKQKRECSFPLFVIAWQALNLGSMLTEYFTHLFPHDFNV
jgi:hypothetical protein